MLALSVLFQGDMASPAPAIHRPIELPRLKGHADENFWAAAAISAPPSARKFKEGGTDLHDDMLRAPGPGAERLAGNPAANRYQLCEER